MKYSYEIDYVVAAGSGKGTETELDSKTFVIATSSSEAEESVRNKYCNGASPYKFKRIISVSNLGEIKSFINKK